MYQQIDVKVKSPATAATIYKLLRDGASWPTWSPIGSFELEQPAPDGNEGVGAIRIFRTKRWTSPITVRERIVELVTDRRFSYQLLSGLPVRDYRADVDLEPTDGGTTIHWHASFAPKLPGTGWLYRMALQRIVEQCARGLATQTS